MASDDSFGKEIHVVKPCPVSWETMIGDDKLRFCGKCEKHVYNFNAMTKDEIQSTIDDYSGKLCVRLYKRADGTVSTGDCPAPETDAMDAWHFLASLISPGPRPRQVMGEYVSISTQIVCAIQNIECGEVITREQIGYRSSWMNVPRDGLRSVNLVIGATSKFSIPAGTVINNHLIHKMSLKQFLANVWNSTFGSRT